MVPDLNRPIEMPDGNTARATGQPERRLLAALVLQAVVDLKLPPHGEPPVQHEYALSACEFLFDSRWGQRVLDLLGIDDERLRNALREGRVPGDLDSFTTAWNVEHHLAKEPRHVDW